MARRVPRTLLARRVPRTLLAASIVCWAVSLSALVVQRHNQFDTFDFDLGIHDQSIWLLAYGKWFNTVCGLPVFGHHAMFAYYVLVPFVWLGGGPNLWNVFQVVALALAAVPVFLLARDRLRNEWVALCFGVAWLLLPTTGFLAWETIHPETMALPFFITGYYLATTRPEGPERQARRHNLITAAFLLAAVLWKEDIALACIGMGVVLTFRGRRRFGPALFVVAVAYFGVVGLWMVPHLAGDTTAYTGLFGVLGDTPGEMVRTSMAHPSLFFQRLSDNNWLSYVWQVYAPVGMLPFLAPVVLVMSLPMMLINLLTINDFTWAMYYHYQAVPIATAMIAAVEGAAFLARRKVVLGRVAAGVVLASALVTSSMWGILPFSSNYDLGWWSPDDDPAVAGWQAALERVGPTDIVSAHYKAVPHLTHREVVYTFPNPWIRSNFLNDPARFVSPSEVKWLVLQDGTLQGKEEMMLSDLLARGEYGDAQTVAGVTTYRRLLP